MRNLVSGNQSKINNYIEASIYAGLFMSFMGKNMSLITTRKMDLSVVSECDHIHGKLSKEEFDKLSSNSIYRYNYTQLIVKRESTYKIFNYCAGCGQLQPVLFMVHNKLWELTVDNPHEILCLPCFTKKLGRNITKDDLTDCSLNEKLLHLKKTMNSLDVLDL